PPPPPSAPPPPSRPPLSAATRRRFGPLRLRVPAENRRQAFVLRGARVLSNARGSAPGQLFLERGRALALLPGPFSEMAPMFLEAVLPALRKRFASRLRVRRALFRFGGISESAADERLRPVLRASRGVEFTLLAGPGLVELHASASAATARGAQEALELVRARVERRMRGHLCRHGETLESALGEALLQRGWRLAAAESCTGGLLSKRLTDVPGASRWFLGSAVAYGNALKRSLLGVSGRTLARFGAVSAACAREMARGARERFGADAALSITGIAGPTGGTKAKPVGTAFIGLSLPGRTTAFRRVSPGTREGIRERTVSAALWRLYRELTRIPGN
ncbi:MAG TPA: competence/damage-inducible protein A, partial [Elusimicrobia bacterium]|nr:competence/damage-inducible protein A [Elusimicrobiota bacterium]